MRAGLSVTIRVGARELAAVVVFLLGLAIGVGRLLQRVEALEQHDTFYHGILVKESR